MNIKYRWGRLKLRWGFYYPGPLPPEQGNACVGKHISKEILTSPSYMIGGIFYEN